MMVIVTSGGVSPGVAHTGRACLPGGAHGTLSEGGRHGWLLMSSIGSRG